MCVCVCAVRAQSARTAVGWTEDIKAEESVCTSLGLDLVEVME